MSLAPQAPDGSTEQGRDAAPRDPGPRRAGALPRPLEALEQLAQRELARLQAGQLPEPDDDDDEMMRALAWDLGLSGDDLLPK